MGKKRIEKIERIKNSNQRKVTLCKRKKGILKKAIELSVLCELEIFMFIYDRNQQRVSHYASHEDFNFIDIFNKKCHREFFTNFDYGRVGGSMSEIDDIYSLPARTQEQIEAISGD